MARFKVVFSYRAKKDLDNLSDKEFKRIVDASRRLEENPTPDGKHIKKLRGYRDLYRLRVGVTD